MTDITDIFSGQPYVPEIKRVAPPENQLIDAIIAAGIEPQLVPADIHLDGQVHRFRIGKDKHDQPGWYIAFADGVPAGAFGNWRDGTTMNFRADIGRDLSVAEEMALARRQNEARVTRERAQAKKRAAAANTAESIWFDASRGAEEHPYLKRKGIEMHGARVTGDGRLIVPLYAQDETGKMTLSSLQYISASGEKLYHSGAKTSGCYWWLGDLHTEDRIYVTEGFATGASVNEVTGKPVVIAYSASNLVLVVGELRARFGDRRDIVIVVDNDANGTGQNYADQACAKFGTRSVMPDRPGDANDYMQAGGDLLALIEPQVEDSWLIGADAFAREQKPVTWLIKHWLQANALAMVHGQSGSGKTFLALDFALRIASGLDDWGGNVVKHRGGVVYLAGEGHVGLRARIAGWKHHHEQDTLNMWVSSGGCDLDKPEGYRKVVEHVQATDSDPALIVVDTLHRFLAGDENSAVDTKKMLDACAGLMAEFGCTVLLVHHTGVNPEAQARARGSSAWRGALDIEISVKGANPKTGEAGEIVQRKQKDGELAEPLGFELRRMEVPGWLDEDGEQVTTAVVTLTDAPVAPDAGLHTARKQFEDAWAWSGYETDADGMPMISRSALRRYLIEKCAKSERMAKDGTLSTPRKCFTKTLNDHSILRFDAFAATFSMACDPSDLDRLMLLKNA